MTQFKEKSDRREFVSAGLFTYPILMAGDILLYQTDRVPIGDDQRQHLELARDIAERFNARFGETFVVPDGIYPEVGARIMDLQEPTKKMSTTGGTEQGTVKAARRARHDPQEVPLGGHGLRSRDPQRRTTSRASRTSSTSSAVATGRSPDEVEAAYDGTGYGDLKSDVGEAVVELLAPVRERYLELRADEPELVRLLAVGAEKARAASAPTLETMYERMGFVRPV